MADSSLNTKGHEMNLYEMKNANVLCQCSIFCLLNYVTATK